VGRPAKDAQLVIGPLLLKHITRLSDEASVEEVLENPYMQAFCGFQEFPTEDILDSSTLTKMQERLGLKFFKELERKTHKVLMDRKIIRAKGMIVDAKVFPEEIKYPNDVGLLNKIQEWLVKQTKRIGKALGETGIRTYGRPARKEYLNFSKKKTLQYVRCNLKQLKGLVEIVRVKRQIIQRKIRERLEVAEEIFRQHWEMYRRSVNRIANRIASFHRPYVRSIKRGKQGKEVEFGGKGAVVHVGEVLFLDYFKHEAYDEAELAVDHVAAYQERFGTLPPYFAADQKY
jgi:IS5 family transposase